MRDELEQARLEGGAWTQDSLETLAFFMRTFGNAGFATDEVTAEKLAVECMAWSDHLLDEGGPSDWRGIRRYFRARRDGEFQYVEQLCGQASVLVADVVSGLQHTLKKDEEADHAVAGKLRELRCATEEGDLDELRQRAMDAVVAVDAAARDRLERHRGQVRALIRQVARVRSELQTALVDAQTDGLTQLYNRETFDKRLAQLLAGGHAPGTVCLLMLDIDHFKQVNDRHGHHTGDAVLRSVADSIRKNCMRKTDFVARYGGDEFVILLQDTTLEESKIVAARLVSAMRANKRQVSDGETLTVTLSIGIAVLETGDAAGSWLARADAALYRVKDLGRDGYAAGGHGH